MDFIKIAKDVLETEANELLRAADTLDGEIEKAVEIAYNTKGKLIVTGVGKSGLIGAKIAATLASTGTSSFFIHPTEAMHGDLGMISKDDSVLAISYSGESEELIRLLPHLKRFDIPLIAMAKSKDTTLGRYADVFLSIDIEKEACPLNTAPTSSTTLTLALGDALAVCLMKKRGFKKEDFASFHPGGSLGKKLFVKVKDIMQKELLPICDKDTPMKEAVMVMSEGRLGNAFLVDKDKKLVAVLSDGDVRRALQKEDFDIEKEACPLNTAPTSSTTLTLALGDALAVCLMKKRGFKKEDFASFHPGGSLGKKLFVKVKDIMQKELLPICDKDTPMKEAVMVMSEGRLGNAFLVDKDKKLVAVLSDGDVRRALQKEDFDIEKPAFLYASKNPKTINDENMLASDALREIEKYKIQILCITDKDRHIKGALHIHHLVEAGIK